MNNIKTATSKDSGINWWRQFEQESIKMAIHYRYCVRTDLVNCYGSVYTHTIAWDLYGKDKAKRDKDKYNLLGNKIDSSIQNMQSGQTNGIPQGSVLFDLIAELILGYSDSLLIKRLDEVGLINEYSSDENFKILRYRDDYRIFANSKETLDIIVKELAKVSADLNMHFNNAKTEVNSDIISTSVKPDKMYWLDRATLLKQPNVSQQKKLLLIYKLSLKYPNSGSIKTALISFKKILRKNYYKLLRCYADYCLYNILVESDPFEFIQSLNLNDCENNCDDFQGKEELLIYAKN